MQGAFYATPIIYPLTILSDKVAKILTLNPVAQIIQDMRHVVITPITPTIASIYGTPYARLISFAVVIGIAVFSMWFFRRQSKYFAEEV
jgi:ABC-2 type transport system permease protein